MFRRLWDKIKSLWKLAKSERATPREIFWAVFLGGFAGCTPAVGFHGWVAVGFATIFRKNRLFAWIGSRISNMFFLPFIIYAEVELAHRARTGAWAVIDLHDKDRIFEQAKALLLDWFLGTIPVGTALGLVCGALGWVLAVRRDRKRALASAKAEATPAPPAEPRAPSSGSPA